jgi:hypothetical protein
MTSALFYLQYHSLRNHLVMRVKRLKQPKYLVGGIAGGLYFYFYFFRYLFGMGGRHQAFSLTLSPEALALWESAGAVILLVVVLMAWLVPHDRAALTFSEAEVAFLFPAPISRRGLIHFKLLRSQGRILVTILFMTLIGSRFGGKAWIHAIGWWLIFSTLNLHLLGCSFARTMLLDRGITNWQRRAGILGLLLALGAVVVVWTRRTIPAFDLSTLENLDGVKSYFDQVLAAGPLPYLLYPFRLVVRPYLAPDAPTFLLALGPALLLLALHYVWVIRSNVAFEEASVEASRKLADRIATVRAGNWQGGVKKQKGKRAPFTLRPEGPAAVALLWKNLISTGQMFTLRLWIMLAVLAVCLSMGFAPLAAHSNWLPVFGMLSAMFLVWSLFFGPQLLRQDLRQDLALADILKTYPMHGWQVALGELLAPAVILTAVQWFLLIIAVGLSAPIPRLGLERTAFLGIGFGAAVIAPMLNLIQLQIPNAAVLLFPAWFQAAKDSPRGIEATGQRLIFMLGQLLAFALALIPAAAVFTVVFLVAKMLLLLGLGLAIPLASMAAAVVLAVEAALGLLLLGRLFDRFDLSAEAVQS